MPPTRCKVRKLSRPALVKIDTRQHRMFRPMQKLTGGVIGHSFIKNIIRYVEREIHDRGWAAEIKAGKRGKGASTAEILELDWHYDLVFMQKSYWFGGDEWQTAVNIVLAGKTDVLLINIGSNDICDIIRNFHNSAGDRLRVESLVTRIVQDGCKFRDVHGVRVVKFMSVLKRVARTRNNRDRFTKCMGYFNDELRRQCGRERGLYAVNVEGFACRPDGSAMEVEDWSPDGSHPGIDFSHPSFQKYYQEVRGAMNEAVPLFE